MRSRLSVVLALSALGAASLSAQSSRSARSAGFLPSVDSSLFHGLHFRNVGPPRGGRVTTVTGVPSQPKTFYMGVASGGVFKTTDGGESWLPITDGQVPLGSTGSIAVAESDPNVVYLGTGSDDIRSNVSTGRGVYRSNDAGATWSFIGLRNVGQIGAVRIDPRDPNTVYVAAIGDAFSDSPDRGVYKTIDGGKNWRKVLFLSDSVGAADLELQPGSPNVIYASMWRGERKPWTIISGSTQGGLYKSTDAGENWTKLGGGLPTGLFGKSNVAVTAADPQRVYALIEAKPGGGFYRSNDAGATWKLMSTNPQLITRPFYYTTLGADPTNADVVYGGAENFYKSTDGGATWRTVRTPHGDNHDIWINPRDGNTMIQANDGGANVSFDGGRTWSTQMNQPTAEIYGVWLDDQFPYRLYGAQQDASTVIVPSRAIPGDNDPFKDGPGCETGPIMPHPKNPNIVYGACKGQFGRMFMNTGQEQAYWVGAQSLYGNDAKDLIYRFQRVSPMETSLFDSSLVYYGSQFVHRSRDGGVHWETISPDLTAHPAYAQGGSGEPITRDVTGEEFYSTIYAISESKTEPGVIWTGSNDGPFYISRDNGKTWTNITPRDLKPGGRVQYIETSPSRKGAAYYAVYRYLLGDYHPYIYETTDYGKSWKLLTSGSNGIAADEPTRVVREDPVRPGLLYAGTEFGLYVSFDDGGHWQPFQLNLPNVPVTDIKVHHNDLVLSTQGRSFWILDDISPLRQITSSTAGAPAQLFASAPAVRTRATGGVFGGGRGAARAPGQPEFPPNGVPITYSLASGSGPVTIEIRDNAGAVVRTLTSNGPTANAAGGRGRGAGAADAAGDAGGDEEAPRFRRGGAPTRLSTNAGLNRVIWDFADNEGETVPPGVYQVRMTTGSWTGTQPLTLTIDPREASDGLTVADLRAQYEHNLQMRKFAAETERLAGRIRQARTAAQQSGGVSPALQALAVTMFGPDEGVRYGRPGLETQVTYLASMTERADQKVGADAGVRYAELRKELDAAEAAAAKVLPPAR